MMLKENKMPNYEYDYMVVAIAMLNAAFEEMSNISGIPEDYFQKLDSIISYMEERQSTAND